MNILLVDDEPLILAELKAIVTDVLPEAVLYDFSDAEQALSLAASEKMDIAFLDISMRYINGIKMAQQLTALNHDTDIIFCTGYSEYALDAHRVHCSGYLLKPITEEKIRDALKYLRHGLPDKKQRVVIRCFGNFEVYCDGAPVVFQRKKTKELLAYLVDRNGADCTPKEIMAVLFEEDDKRAYFDQLRLDLIKTFNQLDLVVPVIRQKWGTLGINRENVQCDFFDEKDGKARHFSGEYMTQYSWAEITCANLMGLSI